MAGVHGTGGPMEVDENDDQRLPLRQLTWDHLHSEYRSSTRDRESSIDKRLC